MDYSKFVFAVQNGDSAELNSLSPVITGVLIKFLKVRLNASHHDAQDCAQNTLLLAIEKIKAEQVQNPDSIIYYMFATAKHDYIKSQSKLSETNYLEVPDSHAEEGDQLTNLLDEERQSILQKCLSLLKPDLRDYISYWFNNPADEAVVVADYFGISVNNAWIKKHRILNMLRECCQKKLNI